MLSDEETYGYIRAAKQGDERAKETLLEHNASLLKSIVRRYLGKGVEFDDLFQLASLGLLKAVYGFDESFGVRFSTYAVPMIAGEIRRFLRDDGMLKVSRSLKELAGRIYSTKDALEKKNGKGENECRLPVLIILPGNVSGCDCRRRGGYFSRFRSDSFGSVD